LAVDRARAEHYTWIMADGSSKKVSELIGRAREFATVGHTEDALQLLLGGDAAFPNSKLLLSEIGLVFERRGQLVEALEAFRRATLVEPSYADHYNAGNMLLALGRANEAIPEFQASLRCDDSHPEAWVNLGIAYYRLSRPWDARRCFAAALALDGAFVPALRCLGTVLSGQGFQSEAERVYARVADLCPEDPQALADHACALGEFAHDGTINLEPHEREWRALEACNRALARDASAVRVWLAKAAVLHRCMHANACFRRLTVDQLDVPGTFESEPVGGERAHDLSGAFVFIKGPLEAETFVDEQLRHLSLAQQRFPMVGRFAHYEAMLHEFMAADEQARASFERAHELEPGALNIATAWLRFHLDRDEFGEARAALERIVQRSPDLRESLLAELGDDLVDILE